MNFFVILKSKFISLILFVIACTSLCQAAETDKTVLLSILARNKAHVLPRYLHCIDELDYNKKLITIYINTNNNSDTTQQILESWAELNKDKYAHIIFDSHNVADLEATDPHEWTSGRFKVLGAIRNASLKKTLEHHCNYYFVVDCDNFIAPSTLRTLVSKAKPIIAPMLRAIPEENNPYSNFFCDVTENGYYKDHQLYWKILNQETVGTFKVPVVHCTYLIDAAVINKLRYLDETRDHEFVIFSRSARANDVEQYICNEDNFGTLVNFSQNVTKEQEEKRLQEYFKN